MLAEVKSESDVWALAKALRDLLEDQFKESDEELDSGPSAKSAGVARSEDPAEVEESTKFETEFLSLLLTRDLVNNAAELSGHAVVALAKNLASDALYVARTILGSDNSEIAVVIAQSLGLDTDQVQSASELSLSVQEIASINSPDARRIATKIALALVDVGEYSAALDDEVTKEETDRIDGIRLKLRDQLADKIDVASDAIVEFEQKFSHLVGMESVKTDLRKRVDFLVVNKRRQQRGHVVSSQRMHMAFVGNPGTGKTTVARLYAELLQNVGLLPSNRVVETDRSGLVAEYVGQTDKKTKDVIKKANGGVLFIDEAYALNDRYGNQKGFGEEATDVLVKEMEDRRDSLVVIVAGYKEPMMDFIQLNPGLKSRIPVVIDFPDYSDDELIEITQRIGKGRGLTFENEALEKVRTLLNIEKTKEGFGNAREVENLIDAAQRNLTLRISHLGNLATEVESHNIVANDIPDVPQQQPKKQIGFSRND
jgi:SpoVK/Ycf46/Vps4 family AAA+-type ATPase